MAQSPADGGQQQQHQQRAQSRPAVLNKELDELRSELEAMYLSSRSSLDGYLLFLLGIVRRGLGMKEEALTVLAESVTASPCNWSAWQVGSLINSTELAQVIRSLTKWRRPRCVGTGVHVLRHRHSPATGIARPLGRETLQSAAILRAAGTGACTHPML